MDRLRRLAGWLACWAILLLGFGRYAIALEWVSLAPNPAYSRDFAMGASTIALSYAPQSESINPAGLTLFDPRDDFRGTIFLNPGAALPIYKSWLDDPRFPRDGKRFTDALRLAASGAAVQARIATFALLLSQPVTDLGDHGRYRAFENGSPLSYHQNSALLSLALHPRVSVGGRIDRYFDFDSPLGTAYSYGVILRPRGVRLGVQYQRFPTSGPRVWHPLDHRGDQTTTAGIAIDRQDVTVSVQVMNLTRSDGPAFLEPHAGIEWRPVRAIALRAGGMQFSRSAQWAWTSGIGLLDANWLRKKSARLMVPDDVLQLAVGMVYDKRTPRLGIGSVTCAWRF
jgi:hypothetical protein